MAGFFFRIALQDRRLTRRREVTEMRIEQLNQRDVNDAGRLAEVLAKKL